MNYFQKRTDCVPRQDRVALFEAALKLILTFDSLESIIWRKNLDCFPQKRHFFATEERQYHLG